jgi:WhiB family redox-sensing transcriptional regulator
MAMRVGGVERPNLEYLLAARPKWQLQAACRGVGVDVFFPGHGGSTTAAKALCAQCPVREECESFAVETGSAGVWAGRGRRAHPAGGVIESSGRA